ncbi:MAG: hypothetical protein IJ598_02350 [Ruminococcus sp.]|nr:hypothetical protein [Ruminococcus sp.]
MEENRSTITYDDDWQRVTEPETPVIVQPSEKEPQPPEPSRVHTPPSQLLLAVQLIVCLLIALAALVLKSVGGEMYHTARQWYTEARDSSAIFDGRHDFDLSALLMPSTSDEA